jgi:beta-lactamase superfamily II metal-dependent hydrolase
MAVKTKKKEAAGGGKLRVRMYRVGMGDCFLVTIPDGKKGKHILIDCGVHSQSQFKGLPEAVQQMEKDTGGKLAVVVATHAHADHISGFGTESEVFERMEIGEVWLPYFENLSNPKVKKLHKAAAALTAQLEQRATRLAASGARDNLLEWITENAAGSFFGAAGRSSTGNNATALKLLRGGFGDPSKTKYLKAGDVLVDAGGIKGLTVRVLAPSDDEKFLSKMHPPTDQLYGLAAHGNLVDAGGETLKPFGDRAGMGSTLLTEEQRKKLADQVAVPWTALALAVDNYLNNTSLSLLLQYKGKTLLFPGDAQWGNWMSWEGDWESILNDIDFYKVGHHGSHNATPKKALELMTARNVAAMASTDTVKSFNRGHFPVPYPKLVTAVKKQVAERYAQSDELDDAPKPFKATERYCDYEL